MSFFDDPPLHDFPDRAIRRIQASPENLRDLIADLLPDLSWGVRRRPGEEREDLLEAARSSQIESQHREEVEELSTAVVETWEQELVARGEARGEARGRAEGLMEGEINTRREDLRLLLEERFGPLPEALAARIAAVDDAEALRNALRQVVHLRSLEDLAL